MLLFSKIKYWLIFSFEKSYEEGAFYFFNTVSSMCLSLVQLSDSLNVTMALALDSSSGQGLCLLKLLCAEHRWLSNKHFLLMQCLVLKTKPLIT